MYKTCITILSIFSLFSHLISQQQITNHKGTALYGEEFIHEYNDKLYRIYFDEAIIVVDITDSSNIKLLYDIDLPEVDSSAEIGGERKIYLFNNYVIYNPGQSRLENHPLYFFDLNTGETINHNIEGQFRGIYFKGHNNKLLFFNGSFVDEAKTEILIYNPETYTTTKTSLFNGEIAHFNDSYLFFYERPTFTTPKTDLISFNVDTFTKDTISENVRLFNNPKTDYLGGVLFLDSLGNIFLSKGSKFNTEQLLLNGKSDILKYSAFNYKDKISICRAVGDSLEFYTKKGLAISNIYLKGFKDNGYVRNILETTEKDIIIMGRSIVSVDKNTKEYAIFEIPQTLISGVGYDLEAINENHIFQDSFVIFYHHSTSSVMDLYLLNVNTMLAYKVNWTDQVIINYNKKFIKRDGYFYLSGYNHESGYELYVIDFSGNKMPFTGDYVTFHMGTKAIGDPEIYFDKIIYASKNAKNIFFIDSNKKLAPIFNNLTVDYGPILAGDFYYVVAKDSTNKFSIYRLNSDLSIAHIYENNVILYGLHEFKGKLLLEEGINSSNKSITKVLDPLTGYIEAFELPGYFFRYADGDDLYLTLNNLFNKKLYKYNVVNKSLIPLEIESGNYDFTKTSSALYLKINHNGKLYRVDKDNIVFFFENVNEIVEICQQKVLINLSSSSGNDKIYDENTNEIIESPFNFSVFGKINNELIFLSFKNMVDSINTNSLEIFRFDCNENKFYEIYKETSTSLGVFKNYSIVNGRIYKLTSEAGIGYGELSCEEVTKISLPVRTIFETSFIPVFYYMDFNQYFYKISSLDKTSLFSITVDSVFVYDLETDSLFRFTFSRNHTGDVVYEFSRDNTHYFTSHDKYDGYQLYSFQLPEVSSLIPVNSHRNIGLYPVPAHEILNVTGLDLANYHIISSDGRNLNTGTIRDGKIDISNLPTGLYIINFDDKNILPKKFIKQ